MEFNGSKDDFFITLCCIEVTSDIRKLLKIKINEKTQDEMFDIVFSSIQKLDQIRRMEGIDDTTK